MFLAWIHRIMLAQEAALVELKLLKEEQKIISAELKLLNAQVKKVIDVFTDEVVGIVAEQGETVPH